MLEVNHIDGFYGTSQALFGVQLEVHEGEVVGLLGRNGMGKTTTVRAIMGLVSVRTGKLAFEGRDLRKLPPYRIARLGVGLVPEGRQIFSNLTVHENLIATANGRSGTGKMWTLGRVYDLFPILAQRQRHLGNQLSGGEQQMLAIGRALMTNPRLLILDEATEGLAPLVRAEIWRCLRTLKEAGQAILVIDKNVRAMSEVADRHYILEKGRIVWTGSSRELHESTAVRLRHLGV
ncbi:MAG: ABC transporter ATP-binding protein [Syntrophobacteraceae bacterium]